MVTGAVLAGGESRRFGRNKALEPYHGQRFIDHCVASLRPHCDPVLLVANDLSPYYDVAATLVRDVVPHQGPLGGIYTALLFAPGEWVLVKATDMPFLVPELVIRLLGAREGVEAVVPTVGEHYEPLLALYHRRCLPAVADALQRGEKRVVEFYSRVKMRTLDETQWRPVDANGRSFWNMNTPGDWEQLQREQEA